MRGLPLMPRIASRKRPRPQVSLSEARAKGHEIRKTIKSGIDPLAAKTAAKAEAAIGHMAFEQATTAYLDHAVAEKAAKNKDSRFGGRTLRSWRSAFSRFVFPKIGKLDVAEVKANHVTSILSPLVITKTANKRDAKGGVTVAFRLRGRIETVLEYAALNGWRDPDAPNPARQKLFETLLGTAPAPVHHAPPPLDDAPVLYRRVRDTEGHVYG
jgi:hypothetical protein